VTILVDKAYEEANRRAADWAGQMVKRRFAEVYGSDAAMVLSGLQERMESNIRSDGRLEPIVRDGKV